MEEVWKDVVGYEGYYQVSDQGFLKSLTRTIQQKNGRFRIIKGKNLKNALSENGYYIVRLSKEGKTWNKLVHQIVAESFLGHIPNKTTIIVDHKDNNKLNNKLRNLQLISQRKNSSKDKVGGSSSFTGVCWHIKQKRWVAAIRINSVKVNLGTFTNELEASKAYQKRLTEYLETGN